MKATKQNEEKLLLLKHFLEKGETVPIRYKGTSMKPLLQEGDWLKVKKAFPERVRIGSLVLFECQGELTVHCVCLKWQEESKWKVRTCGNQERWLDAPLLLSQLVGVVIEPIESLWRAYIRARFLLLRVIWYLVKIRFLRKFTC